MLDRITDASDEPRVRCGGVHEARAVRRSKILSACIECEVRLATPASDSSPDREWERRAVEEGVDEAEVVPDKVEGLLLFERMNPGAGEGPGRKGKGRMSRLVGRGSTAASVCGRV